MKENHVYEVIKNLVDNNGSKNRAAITLGCSNRTIDRYINGYNTKGKEYFIHGNRGKIPAHALSKEEKAIIVDLYMNKYYDANFAHFTEMLKRMENISVSESTVRNILAETDTISPFATRKTRRALKAKLDAEIKVAKTQKEADKIKSKMADIEDTHPRRPRCANFGEMIQMDASSHLWFGNVKSTLHMAVDDATGIIVGAWFEEQETLKGYYQVFRQILTNYGIPYMFYTDKRTVFEYNRSGSQDTADDSFTQFSYACNQLGVEIKTTSIPQAKGRIERLNGTLQRRLPVELRLEGIFTIEQANEYLPGYIAKHNAQFALTEKSFPSVFEIKPSQEKINMTLAIVAERTIDSGHSVRINNKFYRTLNRSGMPVFFYKGTKGLAIQTFNGDMFFTVDENIYALEEIPLHERTSRNFDFKPIEEKPKKQYIPPANHPWRLFTFKSFVKKQTQKQAISI